MNNRFVDCYQLGCRRCVALSIRIRIRITLSGRSEVESQEIVNRKTANGIGGPILRALAFAAVFAFIFAFR